MKIFYKEPHTKICSLCQKEIKDFANFVQYKQATCPTGMYWKWVGYVCENCQMTVLAPIFKNFQQVWDTHDFEKQEMSDHLLVEPENKRNEDGTARW